MTGLDNQLISSQLASANDAEAIKHLEQAITGGKHWYIALLEAIGLWTSAEETLGGRTYRYLIDGEAFDWLLLAERICKTVDGLLPDDEKNELLFHGKPPLNLSPSEVKELIGNSKYRQHLSYFYGITVEGALLLAVQDEVHKEKWILGYRNEHEVTNEAYQRIYGVTEVELLKHFRIERSYSQLGSATLAELNEYIYWLFKYRQRHCEKARVASDTKKALEYLRRQWARGSFWGALVTDEPSVD